MGLLAALNAKGIAKSVGIGNYKSTDGKALPSAGPKSGMPSLPGQSPLGMGGSVGGGLAASGGQKSYLG